jgi:membrane-bound lytic murein transglycosylase A
LSIANEQEQSQWLMQRLQPHRLESWEGDHNGLLTAYYEPVFDAQRLPSDSFASPLFAVPAGMKPGQPWFTRQEIETLPAAQNALNGKVIAWLDNPIDALVLHIQGSGRLRIKEANGQVRTVRLAFAASNEQPYQSIGRWLLDKGELKDASWPGIKAWLQRNPQRAQALLWQNPRYVFFREEALPDPLVGPRGAQGLPLTTGRSIAVDPQSIPYGTPLWLVSPGPTLALSRLVLAQDTGSAIVGAVRADFFMGTGREAGDIAGRLKQPLRLWALWPKP